MAPYAALIMAIMVMITSPDAAAQQRKKRWWNLDSLAAMNLKFIPIPSISASPETGLRYGLALDYFYKTTKDSDSTIRASFSWMQVAYSTRKQFNLEGFTSTYTSGEKYFIGFRGGFINNYERYWGKSFTPGNDIFAEMTYKRWFASGRFSRNVGHRTFAGLDYYYSNYYNINTDSSKIVPGELPLDPIATSEVGGLGWNFLIDRRDNQFSPTKGMYLDINNSYFFNLRSGQYAYYSINIDARKYQEFNRHVLAGQVVFNHLNGNVPLLEKLRFGGANVMRGFFMGRFRDNNLWAVQTEYRYKLSNAVRLAAFVSAGGTAAEPADVFRNDVHVAGGTGVRLLFNKLKKVYLRADVAATSVGTMGYYFRIGEAF